MLKKSQMRQHFGNKLHLAKTSFHRK